MSKGDSDQLGSEEVFSTSEDNKMSTLQRADKPTFRLGHVGWYVHSKLNISSLCSNGQGETEESKKSVDYLIDPALITVKTETEGNKLDLLKPEKESSRTKSPSSTVLSAGPSKLSIKSVNGQTLYFCNECSYHSNFKRSVNRHIESVHMGLRSFQCPFCDYKANYMSNIKRHVSSVHDDDRRFACPRCEYRTSDKGHLSSHIKAVHDKLKPFQCPECKYHASKRTDLTIHIKTVHQKEKPHQCPYCTYQASKNGNLKRHIKNIHEDPPPPKRKKREKRLFLPLQTDSASALNLDKELNRISALESPSFEGAKLHLKTDPLVNKGQNIIPVSEMEYFRHHFMMEPTMNITNKISKSQSSDQFSLSRTLLNKGLEISLVSKLDRSKQASILNAIVRRELDISVVPKTE